MQKIECRRLSILGIHQIEERIQHSDAEFPAIQERRVARKKHATELFSGFQNFDRNRTQRVFDGRIVLQAVGKNSTQVHNERCDIGVIVAFEFG